MKKTQNQRYPLRKKILDKEGKGWDGGIRREATLRTVKRESTNGPLPKMEVEEEGMDQTLVTDDTLSVEKRTRWIPISTLTSKAATKDSNLLVMPKTAVFHKMQSKQPLNMFLVKKQALASQLGRPLTALPNTAEIATITTEDTIVPMRPKTAATHLLQPKQPLNLYSEKKEMRMENQPETGFENNLEIDESTVIEEKIIKEENEEEKEAMDTDDTDGSDWIFLVQVDSSINLQKNNPKDRSKRSLMRPIQLSNEETLKELLIEKESAASRNLRLNAERNLLKQKNTKLKNEYIKKINAFLKNSFMLTRIEGALQCMKVRIDGSLKRSCQVSTEEFPKEIFNERKCILNK